MRGGGCCSNGCRDVGVSDVCELVRFVVLSVLVFFLELADFGHGSRCRFMVGFGSVCVSGAAPTHTEQGHVVKANGN